MKAGVKVLNSSSAPSVAGTDKVSRVDVNCVGYCVIVIVGILVGILTFILSYTKKTNVTIAIIDASTDLP